jgi:hypothetical protein
MLRTDEFFRNLNLKHLERRSYTQNSRRFYFINFATQCYYKKNLHLSLKLKVHPHIPRDAGRIPHVSYFHFGTHPLRTIAVDKYKIHISLEHKFRVFTIFKSSYTVLKMSLGLLQLSVFVYIVHRLLMFFNTKGNTSYLMALSFCIRSCSCTMP